MTELAWAVVIATAVEGVFLILEYKYASSQP